MKTKICPKCNRELPATKEYWYSDIRKKDGLYPSCKTCKDKQVKEYKKTDRWRKIHNDANKRNKNGYMRKHLARNRIYKRTKRRVDLIWRPCTCPICWDVSKIEAHHPDYNKWYEVVFCCALCHSKIHLWWIKHYKIINLLELWCRQVKN